MRLLLGAISAWAVPLVLAGIPLYALSRKVNVYAAFLEFGLEFSDVVTVPEVGQLLDGIGLRQA